MVVSLHGPFYAETVRHEFDLQQREIANSKLSRKATSAVLSATMVATPFLGAVPAFASETAESVDTTKLVQTLNSTEESVDGTDVAKSKKWVDTKIYKEAEKEVSTAKTQAEVDKAQKAVEESAKPGTKEEVKDISKESDTTKDAAKETTSDKTADETVDKTVDTPADDKVKGNPTETPEVKETEVKKEEVKENTNLVDINDGTVDISSFNLGSTTTSSNTSSKYNVVATNSTEKFISTLANNARSIAQSKDLYASVMIAQGILESGSGTSQLYCQDKNIFGIKGVYVDKDGNRLSSTWSTNEDDGTGNYYSVDAGFRSYNTFAESLEDYANLLTSNSLYKGALKSNTTSYKDATKWLQGRYATSTTYAEKLNSIIEAYDLTQYDTDFTYTTTSNFVNNETVKFEDYLGLESLATSYLGTPYVWGGTTPNGFDCSGLVQYVYKHALNIDLPRVTYNQQTLGTTVDVDVNELRLGDLLYWGDPSYHVAMYLGGGNFIEAPQPGETVKVTSLQENTPTFAKRLINFSEKQGETSVASITDEVELLSTDSAVLATDLTEPEETRSNLFNAWYKMVKDDKNYSISITDYSCFLNYNYVYNNDGGNPFSVGSLAGTNWSNYAKEDESTTYKYTDFDVATNISYLSSFGYSVYKTGNFIIVYKTTDMIGDREGAAVYGYVYEYTDDKSICLSKSKFAYWSKTDSENFDKTTILKDAYGYEETK